MYILFVFWIIAGVLLSIVGATIAIVWIFNNIKDLLDPLAFFFLEASPTPNNLKKLAKRKAKRSIKAEKKEKIRREISEYKDILRKMRKNPSDDVFISDWMSPEIAIKVKTRLEKRGWVVKIATPADVSRRYLKISEKEIVEENTESRIYR